jgi:hypothetical protein
MKASSISPREGWGVLGRKNELCKDGMHESALLLFGKRVNSCGGSGVVRLLPPEDGSHA